jgi:outer membrane protein OmpA-like peptidoglycan-associated protein
MEDLKMNRQSPWLFEAPITSEATLYTNPYSNPEYYSNSEWEAERESKPPLCPGISKFTHIARTLKVLFKEDFQDFRREVERAVGRWTIFRSDGGKRIKRLIEPWIENLRSIHKSNRDAKVRPGVSIDIVVNFYYAGKRESLRVCEISILVPDVININGESQWLFEAPAPMQCSPYQPGEVAKSKTQRGFLPSKVIQHPRGLLIADFGVDWSTPNDAVKREPLLREWLRSIVQVVRANPSTKIRIIGFSDCVGKEKNNSFLRRHRARRVYQLLDQLLRSSPQWKDLRSRITTSAAPTGDYIADNSTIEGRAKNRGVLIENTRVITFDDGTEIVGRLPDTIDRIIKRGLELTQQLEHFGSRITKYQQQRIRCILSRLSQPGFDDQYLIGQDFLDYQNRVYDKPYFAKVTQWLLPESIVKTKEKRTDADIWQTLISIDQGIIGGRRLINQIFENQGAATSIRAQQLRDWVGEQENDPRSIYRCYKLQSQL